VGTLGSGPEIRQSVISEFNAGTAVLPSENVLRLGWRRHTFAKNPATCPEEGRRKLLVREKEFTRLGDRLSAEKAKG
jgi:hypothetical protein